MNIYKVTYVKDGEWQKPTLVRGKDIGQYLADRCKEDEKGGTCFQVEHAGYLDKGDGE